MASAVLQDYLCQRLLGWDVAGQAHDAAYDAVKSMRLYHTWYLLQQDQAAWQQAQVCDAEPKYPFHQDKVCISNTHIVWMWQRVCFLQLVAFMTAHTA